MHQSSTLSIGMDVHNLHKSGNAIISTLYLLGLVY
jgi:hypothetical protein